MSTLKNKKVYNVYIYILPVERFLIESYLPVQLQVLFLRNIDWLMVKKYNYICVAYMSLTSGIYRWILCPFMLSQFKRKEK